jgi:hypothetical protein
MNREDPTDIANVSLEGVTERLQYQRAAEKGPPAPTQAQKKGTAAAVPPAKVTAKEAAEQKELAEYDARQTMLDKIGKYRERFPKLKKRNGTLSIKSSLIELDDELHYIEQQLGAAETGPAGALKPANMCLIGAMYGIEMGSTVYNPLKLQLKGLGQTTQASIKTFEPLLDEFMIKHAMDMSASVEFRIGMLLVTTVLTVHMANSGQSDLLSKFVPTAMEEAAKEVV